MNPNDQPKYGFNHDMSFNDLLACARTGKIEAIKMIRLVSQLGLREAKDLFEAVTERTEKNAQFYQKQASHYFDQTQEIRGDLYKAEQKIKALEALIDFLLSKFDEGEVRKLMIEFTQKED